MFGLSTSGSTRPWMGGPSILNVIDEYSCLALAIRVVRCCRAAEVIDTTEEFLELYPPPTYLRMYNCSDFITSTLQK